MENPTGRAPPNRDCPENVRILVSNAASPPSCSSTLPPTSLKLTSTIGTFSLFLIMLSPAAGLLPPLCDVCRRSLHCAAAGRTEPDFPRCHRTFQQVPTERVRALMNSWFDATETPPEADAAMRHVLSRFAGDRYHSSDMFEPSISIDDSGVHFARFSYSLAELRASPDAAARWAHEFGLCFGPVVGDIFHKLLKRVRHPCVEQILVGAAFDAPGQWRAKLYVQFKDGAGVDALQLTEALTAIPDLTKRSPPHPLHLLGIDIGETGIRGVKLYYMLAHVGRHAAIWGQASALFDQIFANGAKELTNVLSIHQVTSLDDDLRHPSDVDLHLGENGLRWSDLSKYSVFDDIADGLRQYEHLKQAFDLTVRRMSVSVASRKKLNLYFALARREPVSPFPPEP